MDEIKLKAEMLELLKKYAKPREEVPEAVADYFTEERFDEMANGLVELLSQYAKREEQ